MFSRICIAATVVALLLSCSNGKDESTGDSSNETMELNPAVESAPSDSGTVTWKVYRNDDGTGYGYDILIGGKVYVHQPRIPAVSGNKAFNSEEDAAKVAAFVSEKVRMNVMPPTVSVGELDSMGVGK